MTGKKKIKRLKPRSASRVPVTAEHGPPETSSVSADISITQEEQAPDVVYAEASNTKPLNSKKAVFIPLSQSDGTLSKNQKYANLGATQHEKPASLQRSISARSNKSISFDSTWY
jgi:hypothetical protein